MQGDAFSSQIRSFFCTVGNGFLYILEHSRASLVGAIFLLIAAYFFVPPKMSWKKRAIIGVLHVTAHITSALILMLLMEVCVETCIRHKLLATSGKVSILVGYNLLPYNLSHLYI